MYIYKFLHISCERGITYESCSFQNFEASRFLLNMFLDSQHLFKKEKKTLLFHFVKTTVFEKNTHDR